MKLFTIGFTKKSARQFFGILRDSEARRVVDIRLHHSTQLSRFAKRVDLEYFLPELCKMEYVLVPELAPTRPLLDAYKKKEISWLDYERRFLDLMRERRVENTVQRKIIADGCLLCSEDQPDRCHRRLVAEYLREHWGDVEIEHLGIGPHPNSHRRDGKPQRVLSGLEVP